MSKTRLLVVGNGMAGLKFLEELVALGADAFEVTVIGEEADVAYNRVLLSPLLAGEISSKDVGLKDAQWYVDHDITVVTRDAVAKLDTAARSAELASGRHIAFDVCVLATGSSPVRLPLPGAELSGVEVFRTMGDIARLVAAAQRGENAVVIGGGLLGIEAAYGLKRAGAHVTLVHVMDRLMERQLDVEGADILRRALEAKGIKVHLLANTLKIDGSTHAEKLCLSDGTEIPAQLVVMAVGVRPRIEVAKASSIACNRGIVVNDRMETSSPGVFAIGECAEHCGAVYGLVEPAYEHARIAAKVIAGQGASYAGSVLATNLKVSGLPVFSTGDFEGAGCDVITWRDAASSSYRKFVIRDGRLAGAVLVGDTTDALWYRDLIRLARSITAMRDSLAFGRAYAEAA
jgi:nitrite reductase (NADH) large subunit